MSTMTQPAAATLATPTPIPAASSSDKSLKRKLEDALQTLDEAVGPTPSPTTTTPNRPPLKRLRTSRSIYAMLTKYGITKDKSAPTNDLEKLSRTAPNLAAILSRTASRTRKVLPFGQVQTGKLSKPVPQSSDYRPSSTVSFLTRLATYKISTYANKPPAIDAVAASKCGWRNEGKDRLVCGICGVSWVLANRDGMTREAGNALVEKQRAQLVDAHKDGCPWKTRQCDDAIYRIPLQAPLVTIREVKTRALLLDNVMQGVEIKHPLTTAQVQSMLTIISSVSLLSSDIPTTPTEEVPSSASTALMPSAEPSETAVLAALFGWSIPPSEPTEPTRIPSASRAGSVMPATPMRNSMSRASSVARDSTPTPSSIRSPLQLSTATSLLSQHSTSSGSLRADNALVHCPLCQRRIGLWAFLPKPADEDDPMTGAPNKKQQPQRQLDVLREHRSYCPYVVRSTVVPSLPAPSPTNAQAKGHERSTSLASLGSANGSVTQINAQPGAIEGWRAVIAVISRYGAVQRQRLGLNRMYSGRAESGVEMTEPIDEETASIEAMVAGVKTHGGRDLLKYVKGLLG